MLRDRSPHGVSLIELLIVLAILGVAASAFTRVTLRHQRAWHDLAARSLAEAQLREGTEILASALIGVSPPLGDIYAGEMLPSSIAFRAPLGTSLLCDAPLAGTSTVDVVAVRLEPDDGATASQPGPELGDSLWLYDGGIALDAEDDRWRAHLVTAVTHARRACAVAPDTGEAPVTRLSLSPAPSPSLSAHAPARAFRRSRYSLYNSADGAWYLGFSDCRPLARNPACAPMQPVSGPYLPAVPPGSIRRGGLMLEYVDGEGKPTDDVLRVGAIRIIARSNGSRSSPLRDTIEVQRMIALRNVVP